MSMRPEHARWFQLLTAREDLTLAVETLAGTSIIELELQSDTGKVLSLQDLQQKMDEFNRLARRYRPYWPQAGPRTATVTGKPGAQLANALDTIRAWEKDARPRILRLESLAGEQEDLRLIEAMLANMHRESLDIGLVAMRGGTLESRLFALPSQTPVGDLSASVLTLCTRTDSHDFLLAAGTPVELDALDAELAAHKARRIRIPDALHGMPRSALQQVRLMNATISATYRQLQQEIDDLSQAHRLPEALAIIYRLDWLITNLSTFPVSENFAWVTGWTSDLGGKRLSAALADAQVNAVIHFPPPPPGAEPPVLIRNPWWAQPFELFARLLGTPAHDEADPSKALAVLAPLLFGYMFGDVGQGLVLLLAGLALQRRWPVARLLIANGMAAMIFGLVFGSVFGREDIVPALWVHPIADPLPVLMVPLACGVLILLLGMLINAVEFHWRGNLRQWWQTEAALPVLYLSVIASFPVPGLLPLVALATGWYFAGRLAQARTGSGTALLAAAGSLVETLFQLLINTVSFVRVGAFALAHAGLSLAFNVMAATTDSLLAGFLILLLGNVVVIVLEGLVVTIQTTRLILFEFFIRFLRGTGRMFRPLAAPNLNVEVRRLT